MRPVKQLPSIYVMAYFKIVMSISVPCRSLASFPRHAVRSQRRSKRRSQLVVIRCLRSAHGIGMRDA